MMYWSLYLRSSEGKILAKFNEALQNESVTAYITEDGTFDTKLRYVPEIAIHARLHEQGGRRNGIVDRG